jgi:hypothetical protein
MSFYLKKFNQKNIFEIMIDNCLNKPQYRITIAASAKHIPVIAKAIEKVLNKRKI